MLKKGIIVFVATLVIAFGAKFGYDYYQDNYTKISKVSVEEIKTVDRMKEVLNENDVVYVYVGRPNCGDSDIFEEYFIDMMKDEDIDNLYFFNIKDINEKYKEDDEYKKILIEEFDVSYTPTLAKYVDGELVLKSEWTPATGYNKSMAETFIKDSGILND